MVLSGQRCRGLDSRVVGRARLVRCFAMFVQSITRPDNPAGSFFQFSFRLGRVWPLTFSAFFGVQINVLVAFV